MYPAAEPEYALCLCLRVFLSGGEEDVYDQVLIPDSAQVNTSLLCFDTNLLEFVNKSPPILLLLLCF